MLRQVVPFTAEQFVGAVCMPNTVPPVDNAERLDQYVADIKGAAGEFSFDPYVPLFFRADFTEADLAPIRDRLFGIKLYPAGATTNSEAGVKEIDKVEPVLALMEEMDLPLLVHGETGGFSMDREREFVAVYDHIATRFPKLRLIMEHITTVEAAQFLDKHENVFATVTLHHMQYTLDDLLGGMLNPFVFCKPIVKTPEDRDAITELVLTGHPKVMFGSDSAPHTEIAKRTEGAAGCFTSPVLLQELAEFFEGHGVLEKLQAFVSDNAKQIYGVTPPERTVTLEKKSWTVPPRYGSIVPSSAGKELSWSLT